MYVRPNGGQRVSLPQNYSGSLFSEVTSNDTKVEEVTEPSAPPESEHIAVSAPKKDLFSSFLQNEELMILGLILLLSQDGFGDDVIPILLLILLFKK